MCRNRTRIALCHARQRDEQESVLHQAVARVSGIAQAAVVAGVLLVATGTQTADAKTRLTADEQKVVDLFNKSTGSVVNVTNLSSRYDMCLCCAQLLIYEKGLGEHCCLLRETFAFHYLMLYSEPVSQP
jgi:hypothetical protein